MTDKSLDKKIRSTFPIEVDLIIYGKTIITMDTNNNIIYQGAIAINNTLIVAIDSYEIIIKNYITKKYINVGSDILMPGLINGHTHAAMSLFRGISDDLPLSSWLHDIIFPLEQKILDEEFVYWGTKLAALEMVRGGITTVADMYFFENSAAEAFIDIGIRAITGSSIINIPKQIIDAENHISRWKNHDLITPAFAPHAISTVPYNMLHIIAELSQSYNAPILMHVAEAEYDVNYVKEKYNSTPIAYLKKTSLLNQRLTMAHGVHLKAEEFHDIKAADAGLVHCPTSNMKLASGIAPIKQLLNANISIGLGTDGAASNNSLNLFAEMKYSTLMQRINTNIPDALTAITALELATKRGAQAIHCNDKIGSIEEGKKADIISVNLNSLHQIPVYNNISSLVYSTNPSDVKTVIINGNVLIEKGIMTLSENNITILRTKIEYYKNKIKHIIATL